MILLWCDFGPIEEKIILQVAPEGFLLPDCILALILGAESEALKPVIVARIKFVSISLGVTACGWRHRRR